MKKRRSILIGALLIAIVGAGAALTIAVPSLPDGRSTVPTTRVGKSPLKLTVHAIGDLRAGRTITLVAPPVGVVAVPHGLLTRTITTSCIPVPSSGQVWVTVHESSATSRGTSATAAVIRGSSVVATSFAPVGTEASSISS